MNADHAAAVRSILEHAFPDVQAESVRGYVSRRGELMDALSYAQIIWPELVEVDGAVLLCVHDLTKEALAATFRERLKNTSGGEPDFTDFVESFNTFEIRYLFSGISRDPSMQEAGELELAKILAEAWKARLVVQFPSRVFEVRVDEWDSSMMTRVAVREMS